MNIEIAKYSGYCYGVERAFKMVKASASGKRGKIFTLGPLIHNKQAVEELNREEGIGIVRSIREISEGTLIVRTHGVPPKVTEEAKARGLGIIDATCPFVKKAQQRAKELVDEGYHLVIIGEREHPEVVGIKAHSGGQADVVEDENQARDINVDSERLGIVIQTTQESQKAGNIIGILAMKSANVKIYNTICDATYHRQFAARELAQRSDVMIIIGGKHSGNTRRLRDICREICARTYHIEEADEIDETWFKNAENVGISAGASTPNFVLNEVVDRIRRIGVNKGETRSDGK